MSKFLAIFKAEYRKIVMKRSFWIGTILFPFIASLFVIVPSFMFSLSNDSTEMVIVDRTEKLAPRVEAQLSKDNALVSSDSRNEAAANQDSVVSVGSPDDFGDIDASIVIHKYDSTGKTDEKVSTDLEGMVRNDEIDAYLIIPKNLLDKNVPVELYSRKASDFVLNSEIEGALNSAVRSQRLAEANISEEEVAKLSQGVKFNTTRISEEGAETDSGLGFISGFIVAFMIYLSLQIYGQLVMASVVEEKETKVSEILFSSAKPFELLSGKLVGSAAAGLTQLVVWLVSLSILATVGAGYAVSMGMDFQLPSLSPGLILLLLIYFLLGFFLYSSLFAIIGAMVSTVQEGSQFAMVPIFLLLIGFYASFATIRDPNSTISVWTSILPFIAPITMPVRMFTEMPPFWQILLSIGVNALAILLFIWIAARVYRVGMLMYGKRATIPEVFKWIRQS